MTDDIEERLSQVEQSVVKINHFTETFPKLMEVKLDAVVDKVLFNRKLIYFVLTSIVGGALVVLWSLAQSN